VKYPVPSTFAKKGKFGFFQTEEDVPENSKRTRNTETVGHSGYLCPPSTRLPCRGGRRHIFSPKTYLQFEKYALPLCRFFLQEA
jgi:hypothetical protein